MPAAIPECANCPSQICRMGRKAGLPDCCPMLDDFPDHRVLYARDKVRRMALAAAVIEATGYRRWTRVRELVELCRMMDYSVIGVACCPDMRREAKLLARYLKANGLVTSVPCSTVCDPLEQAKEFASRKTELNVLAGMCVGHDALFTRNSAAPVTAIIARDTVLQHNPAAALYLSGSYLHDALYTEHRSLKSGLYSDSDTILLNASNEIAEAGRGRWTRVEEFIELAHRLDARKLGVVFCHGLREEAKVLARVLEANGFQVASVGCKTGAVSKEEFGLADSQKVRPGQPEMICNPLAQADILNRVGTHLNALLGQCVGHDTATMAALKAPTVSLVVKDRVLAHNTVAALWANCTERIKALAPGSNEEGKG